MADTLHLETERLLIRRLTLDDADLMLAVWNDPTFVRYVGDRGIRTLAQARENLTDVAFKMYSEYGCGPYRVALKSDDTAIGTCGIFRREALDEADIGFGFLPAYCGKGYAYEAACAVMTHARRDLELDRLVAIVSPDNMASIALIEKLGLRFEKMIRMPEDDEDVRLYGMCAVITTS